MSHFDLISPVCLTLPRWNTDYLADGNLVKALPRS